jgi:DME family drug/metabolite transporter
MTPSDALPPAPSKLAARLWVVVAALMWSTSGLFAKAPLFDWEKSDRGLILAFWRAAFAALVLLPVIRRPKWDLRLVPMTICFTVMCVTYLTAMTRTTAANAIWLQATSPWWAFLLAVLIFHEPVARRDLVPLGFGVLGVGTILLFELGIHTEGHAPDKVGVLCGLGAGVSYACVVLLMRRLRDQTSAWLIALNHLVATLLLLPWVLRAGFRPRPDQLAVLAGFGIFQMAIPYVLVCRALRTISPQEAIGICLIEPVLTPVWVLLWGEVPAVWTVAGAVLILIGLVLRYVIFEWIAARGRQRTAAA